MRVYFRMPKKSLPSPEQTPVFISRSELAKRWAVGWHTILRRERDGTLKAVKLNGLIRYSLKDVERIEREALAGK